MNKSSWDPLSIIKESLFDKALLIGLMFAVITLIAALVLAEYYLFTLNFYIDIISVSLFILLYVFRHKFSLKIKLYIIILFIYVIFISSVLHYGNISNQKNLVTLLPFLLILLFDIRKTVLLFSFMIASYFVIAYLYLTKTMTYYPSAIDVNESAMFWVLSGLLTFATGLVIVLLVNSYNKEITHIITHLEATTAKLELRDKQHVEHLKEKNIMIQEIHHRVKNNLAVVSGLLELQMKAINDDKLTLAMQKSINRILSIAKVHQMLYQSEDFNKIPFKEYVNELAGVILNTMNSEDKGIQFDSQVDIQYLNINHSVPLGIIFNELMTNSIKYGFENEGNHTITIVVKQEGNLVRVTYRDNGVGISDFEHSSTSSLGFSLIESLLAQIDATHSYETTEYFKLEFSFPAETLNV